MYRRKRCTDSRHNTLNNLTKPADTSSSKESRTKDRCYQNAENPQMQDKSRISPIEGIGHILLLGLTVLTSEIIELTAAKSLEYLLEPCLNHETQESAEDDLLAEQVESVDLGIEEGEFIPIAFE